MKDIYRMLNDVEVDLSEYKEETLNDIERAKLKKNIRKYIHSSKGTNGKKHIIAASMLIGVATMGIGGSVLASGNIMGYDLEYLLGIDRDRLEDYKTIVDQTVIDKSIGVKLNEVILDGQALVISATTSVHEPYEEYVSMASPRVYINGKDINRGSTGMSEQKDESTYVSISNIYLDDAEITEGDIDIKVVYDTIHVGNKKVKGRWVFEFKTNRESLLADTKTKEVNRNIVIDNTQDIYVSNVQITPLATTIEFRLKDRNYDIGFKIEDQDGNEIEERDSSLRSDKEIRGICRYKALDNSVTKIKITPWYKSIPKESGRDSNDYVYMEDASFEIEVN